MIAPTQRKPHAVLPIQARIYQAGLKARPARQLYSWLVDASTLHSAWLRVAAADGADTPGVDGITCTQLRDRVDDWLKALARDLTDSRYRPQSCRWVHIAKTKQPDDTRQIGILSVRDRVVQTAVKLVLEPILDPVFFADSFGFRVGRSVAAALHAAVTRLSAVGQEPFTWVCPLDVADCFGTIDHVLLRMALAQQLADTDLLELIDRLLAVGGQSVGWLWKRRTVGLVQGGSLSPLLCNLALHAVDEAVNDLAKTRNHDVCLLRYADDMLVLGKDWHAAMAGVQSVRATLARLHQNVKHSNAKADPATTGFNWLGVHIRPRHCPWGRSAGFGYVIPDDKVRAMLSRLEEMTIPPSDKIDPSAFNLARWIVSLNTQLRDWHQAYRFADNGPDVFRVLDDLSRERVRELLLTVGGVRSADVHRRFRIKLPRGFWTWEVPGGRLVVLSQLAPHAPANLTRTPAWAKSPNQMTKPPRPMVKRRRPSPSAEEDA
jgi:RNA-directed DNA polymerase